MNPREKKIAAWVGVVIGLYGIDQWLVEPYLSDLDKANTQIERHQSDLRANSDLMHKGVEASKHWKDISSGKMESDPSTAAQLVINRAQECASDTGLKITSSSTEKSEKEGGYDRMTVKVSAEGGIQAIGRFLYEIRESDIPVRVGDIQITPKKDGFDDLQLAVSLTTIISPTATPAKVAVSTYGREGLQ